jgi:hypothetical protein
LLGGAAAVAAASVTGCASKEPTSASGAAPTTVPVTSGFTTGSAAGSDRDIALDALTSEQATLEVYRALSRRHRVALSQLMPLLSVQRRHVDALVTALQLDGPPSSPAVDVMPTPLDRTVAETAMRAAQDRLADCRRVESGNLASMLASMAAAHRVVASQWAAE